MSVPEDADRLIQDVLSEVGWNADPAVIAEKVRQLNLGLPAEDEFAVVCSWLGNCELIHKLDQQQVPVGSKERFQVPDLLAKFSTATSPVLIEIKTKAEPVLSFTPAYLDKVQRYADLLGMPWLIAWKWSGMWVLFEPKHLKRAVTNYKIKFADAMKQSLMGSLAGDVSFTIGTGAGIHLGIRKVALVGTREEDGVTTENWDMVIDEMFFTDFDGVRLDTLPFAVQSLLFAADLDTEEEHTDSHIYSRHVSTEPRLNLAHRALVNLLSWEAGGKETPSWRQLLRTSQVSATIESLSKTLRSAMEYKIVHTVLNVVPHDVPPYVIPPASD
jgi:Holliday junction resolvase